MFSTNLRDCPKGKSIPAIQGPGLLRKASNPLNDGHPTKSLTRRTLPSNSQFRHVSGFDRLGRLVKSMPTTFMSSKSTFEVLRKPYCLSRYCFLNAHITSARELRTSKSAMRARTSGVSAGVLRSTDFFVRFLANRALAPTRMSSSRATPGPPMALPWLCWPDTALR
jgi:hypothetical protein